MKAKNYTYLFIVLIGLYLGLTFIPTIDPNVLAHYHISSGRAELLNASFVIPLVCIWLLGLYGFLKIKSYSQIIKKSKDGQALSTVSNGLMYLALGPPVTAVLASIFVLIVREHPTFIRMATITNNYLSLFFMAMGLHFIARGAEQLVEIVNKKPTHEEQRNLVIILILLSTLYTYFIITRPVNAAIEHQVFFMPNWLVILTIAVPYLYFWYRGLLGSYYMYHYQKHVKGKVYKRSLNYVAAGIATVVLTSILLRLLTTVAYKITRFNLTPLLFIVYGILMLTGLGYALVAIGAKKLRRIEEV